MLPSVEPNKDKAAGSMKTLALILCVTATSAASGGTIQEMQHDAMAHQSEVDGLSSQGSLTLSELAVVGGAIGGIALIVMFSSLASQKRDGDGQHQTGEK